ncbi:MAG: PAS domain S-box protein [Planctomycetes bacterium]|nr:PAS domain S-box protein [Planctomycetota bacterium]
MYVNKYAKNIWGDVEGNICWQSFQKDQSAPCSFCTNDKILKPDNTPGPTYVWEFQNTISGNWYYIQDRAIQWFDDRIVRLEIATDITVRKQSEERIESLAKILEESLNEVYIFNKESLKFIQVNKGARQNLGYSMEELLNLTPLDLKPEFTYESFTKLVMPLLTGEEELVEFTTLHRRKDHSLYDVDVHIQLSTFQSAPVFVAIILDITKRKEAEAKLLEYQEGLEHLVDKRTRELEESREKLLVAERLAVLGKLTSVVSHELRNPLGTILSSLFTIRERLTGKGLGTEKAIDRAERSVKRCDNIIGELLFYTRTRNLNRETTAIDKWLGEFLDEHEIPDGISLTRELSAEKEIMLDQEKFRRCMINVVNNACESMVEKSKAWSEKSGKIESSLLTVSAGILDNRLNVQVTDTGTGISREGIKQIFEPLFSTKSFGAGLGLPIVKQIMEQHNGGIEVEGKPGKGATVTLWLPV